MSITFSDIQSEWKKDSKLDENALDKEALKTCSLYAKYMDWYTVKKLQLSKAESELRQLRRLRYLYYRGVLDLDELKERKWEPWQLDLTKNTDIQNVLDGDELLEKLGLKVAYLKEQVTYLENVLKALHARSFNIRDAISYQRMITGMPA